MDAPQGSRLRHWAGVGMFVLLGLMLYLALIGSDRLS